MGQPHKHAELIKAWADGAEIQVRVPTYETQTAYWQDTPTPTWGYDCDYRIKPKTIKYRIYMWKSSNGVIHVNTAYPDEQVDNLNTFIKWLGDWQEVEV